MDSAFGSPIEDINSALLDHNPFSQPPFVNANNVWGKGFPDVESLNAHASDAVFQVLDDICARRYPTASILITAQNGTGKTHIISRIRHRLQNQGGALFIFANRFDNLNEVKQGFQQLIAGSLSNIGSQGVKQWQELATAMANDALKAVNPNAQTWEPKDLVKKLESTDTQKLAAWINKLTKSFCKIKIVQDPDIIRAVFWTLSEDESSYAANWLAGKEIAQFKSNDLMLPNQNQSFDAVLQILDLISQYNALVICFDELDLPEISDSGLHKSQVVAGLVKELFENLKRGVILTVMMPGIWTEKIKGQLPKSVSDKITTYGSPLNLNYPDSNITVDLVAFFLQDYYAFRDLIPPHPVYPFDEAELRAIGQGKPTIREVLQWCREHCKPPNDNFPPPVVKTDPVELAFTSELSEDIRPYLDDNYFLAEALLYGFQTVIGKTIEGVTLEEATPKVGKQGKKDNYLNFKIVGKENGNEVSIGVAVLQQDGGVGFGAGLKRLVDQGNKFNFDLTRGCLVRSKTKPIKNNFMTNYINPLIQKGGEFVELKEQEIKPLVALRAVFQKESDYGVTEEEILQFINNKGSRYWLGLHNPLIKEILSDPSHQIPDGIADEPESTVQVDDLNADELGDLAELVSHE